MSNVYLRIAAAVVAWGVLAGACCCPPKAEQPKAPATQPAGTVTLMFRDLKDTYTPGEAHFTLCVKNETAEPLTFSQWRPIPGPNNATLYLRTHGSDDPGVFTALWDIDRRRRVKTGTLTVEPGQTVCFPAHAVLNGPPGKYDIYADMKERPDLRTRIHTIKIADGPPDPASTSRTCCQ